MVARPPTGSASRERGGAARRGRPRLARRGAQARRVLRWPARHCPHAASVSGRSGQRESRVGASRWIATVPRLLW